MKHLMHTTERSRANPALAAPSPPRPGAGAGAPPGAAAGQGAGAAAADPAGGGPASTGAGAWLVLIVRLPPRPSSGRVRAWRKLRALGAVALKSSVYLLPASPEHYEQLQWLAQEAQRTGGDATLLQVERVENLPATELVRLFRAAREPEYRAIADRYRRLLPALESRTRRPAAVARVADEAARLARELQRIVAIDFFGAPGRAEAERLRDAVARRLAGGAPASPAPATPLGDVRGRRWATRPRPHIDRIASAWLIRRFVDPTAEFVFAPPEAFPPGAIPFDVVGAELGHHGDDCTFETLLRRTGLADARLAALAEIVHDVDLRDGRFARVEAPGIDLALRGLLAALDDDQAVLAHGLTLFDGLYRSVDRGGRPGPGAERA
jgi:hypothetical protein